jgi:catechol 2,3-dioxygenase-like lactoylglutathione lyase family enzyme
MTSQLVAVCFAADRPRRAARFWSGLLGWEAVDAVTLLPGDDTGFRLRFAEVGSRSPPRTARTST